MSKSVVPGSKQVFRNKIGAPKTYASVRPGYTMTLPEGIAFNNGKTRVVFDSETAKEFTTNEIEIQEYIEGLDKFGVPGKPGKNPLVQVQYFYCPTPEEVAEEKAKLELAKNIAFIKANPLFKINVKDLTYAQLCAEAEKFGIATKTDKNVKRAGKDIAEELEAIFSDAEKPEEVEDSEEND